MVRPTTDELMLMDGGHEHQLVHDWLGNFVRCSTCDATWHSAIDHMAARDLIQRSHNAEVEALNAEVDGLHEALVQRQRDLAELQERNGYLQREVGSRVDEAERWRTECTVLDQHVIEFRHSFERLTELSDLVAVFDRYWKQASDGGGIITIPEPMLHALYDLSAAINEPEAEGS